MEQEKQMNSKNIFYSEEDNSWIATCKKYPSLSVFGETSEQASEELQILIEDIEKTHQPEKMCPFCGKRRSIKGKELCVKCDSKPIIHNRVNYL